MPSAFAWRNTQKILFSTMDFKKYRQHGNALKFSKEDSAQAKGLAILVMLFLHLFNFPGKIAACDPLIVFGSVPLVEILGRFAGICVGLYLFLSGFGQFCLWQKRIDAGTPISRQVRENGIRVLRLYKQLWLIGGACVILLAAFGLNRFEISWETVFENATGWRCSFNETWWFLLPWSVVCLASPLLFEFFLSGKNFFVDCAKIVAASAASGGGVFLVFLHVHGKISLPYPVYQMLTTLNLLPVFLLGGLSAKWNLPGIFRAYFHGWGWALLPALVAAHWFSCGRFAFGSLNGFWAVAVVFAFSATPLPNICKRVLAYLGKKSVDMWFIHAFFIAPPFFTYVYAPKNPLLIFVGLILLTLSATLIFRAAGTGFSKIGGLLIFQFFSEKKQ